MRGLFTTGVLDVWMEQGLPVDGFVGVSAGAAFGCNLKSGQIGRALRYNLQYCKDPRYCGFRTWLKTGDLFGAEFCYETLPKYLDPFDEAAFDASDLMFYVVATDANTGKPVYHCCTRANDATYTWIRASASMPLVSKPVPIGTRLFLDGGISDPIPMAFLQSRGYERIVVVLTQPRDYVKKPVPLSGALRRVLRDFPALCDAMCARHLVYESERRSVFEREHAGEIFVIAPPGKLEVSRVEHDRKKLQRAYDQGREAILSRLDALHDFLAQ